jgi:ABC-type multidrug transport system, ATPase component
MKISLDQIGKRFQRHRIFKDITYQFTAPNAYALLGSNGSGKSTLLRIISGMQSPSVGKIHYELNNQPLADDKLYSHVSFCAPGMDIVEEFTLTEFLEFHFSFKKPLHGLDAKSIVALTGLQQYADQHISSYSSGMKQRVKLAQAIFTDTPLLLLDEPCTNLDEAGVVQYREWMEAYGKDRLIIVASNDPREYFFCREQIRVEDYK